jgi:membrane-associated phospholipid phosphatase
MFLLMKESDVLITGPFALVLLLSGVVASSRLLLHAHKSIDMYAGLLWGMVAQIAAYQFVM